MTPEQSRFLATKSHVDGICEGEPAWESDCFRFTVVDRRTLGPVHLPFRLIISDVDDDLEGGDSIKDFATEREAKEYAERQ